MAVRVFISYSHDSEEHMARVLALSNKLREWGVDCIIDRYQQSPEQGWPRWTEQQLLEAEFVLVVCTETYRRRLEGEEPRGTGRGAKWEGALITQQLYDAESVTSRFVPVLAAPGQMDALPLRLRGPQFFEPFAADGELDQAGFEKLYRLLTAQPEVTKPDLGKEVPLQALDPVTHFGKDEKPSADSVEVGADGRGDGESQAAEIVKWSWKPWLLAALLVVLAVVLIRGVEIGGGGGQEEPRVEYSYFKVMPYSLYHSIAANRTDLYWLKLVVHNAAGRKLSVRVNCRVLSNDRWLLCPDQEGKRSGLVTTFNVREEETRKEKTVHPRFDLTVGDNFPRPRHVAIEWQVFDRTAEEGGGALHEGGTSLARFPPWAETVEIEVTPKNRFYFHLHNDKKDAVRTDLMLASLAAWTKIDPGSGEAEQVAAAAGSLQAFVQSAYERLLREPAGLRVSDAVPAFPPEPYEEIRPAKALWAASPRAANPLEAALLLGALARKHHTRWGDGLVLLWPGREGPARSSLFLGWRADDGWNAVDLSACGEPFAENLAEASIRVSTLLGDSAEQDLDALGVHLEESLRFAAIDFVQAAKRFNIEGLP